DSRTSGYRFRGSRAMATSGASTPAEGGSDIGQDRLNDMRIVGDAKLVRHSQQEGVGICDGFVRPELLDENVRLGSIAATENRARLLVDKADLISLLTPTAKVRSIAIIDEREDAAADRDARLARMARLFPGGAEGPDLGSLLDVERLSCFVVLEGRALQVHSEFSRPDGGGVGAGAPPDPIAQALRMGFEAQQSGRIGEHRMWIGLGEALATQQVEEHLGMPPAHVRLTFPFGRAIAEITPSLDDLLRRAPTDSKLQASGGDKVGRPGVFDHVERVFVAHVDDGRADFDTAGPGTHGREQRERRSELPGEVVNAEIGSVRAQRLSRDSEIDGLPERVGRRARLRLRRGRPVPERQKTDLLHKAQA